MVPFGRLADEERRDIARSVVPGVCDSLAFAAAASGAEVAASITSFAGGFLPQAAKSELFWRFRSASAARRVASSRSASSSRAWGKQVVQGHWIRKIW
eukprot:scaffold322141_cov30-Tisochrysis_lutea.AAC.2